MATPYRTFASLSGGAWAYILVIDPNSLRFTDPGPFYFVLDSAMPQPGLTDRSGVFVGTINDNASTLYGRNEMSLFDYIKENDEFWLGIRTGPTSVPDSDNTWTLVHGGQQWIMGGFISKRYWVYDGSKRVTAVIEGKDYMDLWRSQPFGTSDVPRDYVEASTTAPSGVGPVDVSQIVQDVITDVNALQSPDWQFSVHPNYFYPNVIGKEYEKQYKLDDAFSVMQSICVEENFEWQIVPYPEAGWAVPPAQRRAIMFYPRSPSAYTPRDAVSVHYNTVFRSSDKIEVGDTSALVTDVIFSDQGMLTVPPFKSMWGMPGVWMDAREAFKEYGFYSMPLPANTEAYSSAKWGDATQIFDSDGFPAVCFQKPAGSSATFRPVLSFSIDPETEKPTSSKMQLDMRIWRRLHFNFYHASKRLPDPFSWYRVKLHNSLPAGGIPSEWLDYYIYHDFPMITGWDKFTFDLPKVSDEGLITDPGVWVVSPDYVFDATKIDFVSFEVHCAEALIGDDGANPWLGVGSLLSTANVGETFLQIQSPEKYFFRGPGFVEGYKGEIFFGNPMPEVVIDGEWVQIYSILGDYSYQSDDGVVHRKDANVRLCSPLAHTHSVGALLKMPACYSISLSQFYFEKPQFTAATLAIDNPDLANPRRFKITHFSEVEFQSETRSRATQELNQYGKPKQKIEVQVDGDPRHLVGSLIDVYLDPLRPGGVFQQVTLMVDDVSYQLTGVDLVCKLTAGAHDLRSITYSPDMMEALSAAKVRKRNLQRTAPGTHEVKVV